MRIQDGGYLVKTSLQMLGVLLNGAIACGSFLLAAGLMLLAGTMMCLDPTAETYYQMMGVFVCGISILACGLAMVTVAALLYVISQKKP